MGNPIGKRCVRNNCVNRFSTEYRFFGCPVYNQAPQNLLLSIVLESLLLVDFLLSSGHVKYIGTYIRASKQVLDIGGIPILSYLKIIA